MKPEKLYLDISKKVGDLSAVKTESQLTNEKWEAYLQDMKKKFVLDEEKVEEIIDGAYQKWLVEDGIVDGWGFISKAIANSTEELLTLKEEK